MGKSLAVPGPQLADRHPARACSRGVWAGAATAMVLAAGVYANSIGNGFVNDDRPVVLANPAVRDAKDWRAIFLRPSWAPAAEWGATYRPVATWTLAIDRRLFGETPAGYHAHNVVLHALVSGLVVLLGSALGLSTTAAALAGILFACHPVHGEVVASVVGRADLLAAVAGLAALWSYLRASARGFRSPWSLAAVAGVAVALFAKEYAIGLMVCLPLIDLVVTDAWSVRRFAARVIGVRGIVYAALAGVVAGYLGMRRLALGGLVADAQSVAFWMNPLAHVSAQERVATALGLVARALGLSIGALRPAADYSFRTIDVAGSFADGWPLVGIGALLACMLVTCAAWGRSAAVVVGMSIAVAPYLVVSNLLVPIGTVFADRLLYLPSAGVCIVGALGVTALGAVSPTATRAACVALVLWWSAVTWARNPMWHDPQTFAEALVLESPRSGHAQHMLGTAYALLGRDDDALAAFDRAVAIDPANAGSLFNAAVVLRRRGDLAGATARLRQATDADPRHVSSWVNLALVSADQGAFDAARDAAQRAVSLQPNRPDAWMVLAIALRGAGDYAAARAAVETALRAVPDEPRGLAELAQIALAQGDAMAADAALERLVRVAKGPEAYASVVRAYDGAGRGDVGARLVAAARTRAATR